MAYVTTKGRFHVGIDGVGYLLQGAPGRPGYVQNQAPVYGQRFASGDRTYNDLSQWWYFAQTDWSGGIKDDPSWEDDGKFYYSTNIDTWSEPGSIKLLRNPQLDETFTEDITCGVSGEVGGTNYSFIGTGPDGSGRPLLYRSPVGVGQTWSEVSGTTFATARNYVSNIMIKTGVAWIGTVGTTSDTADVINTYDGSTFTEQSTFIASVFTFTPTASRCADHYQGTAYIFVDDDLGNKYGLVKTAVTNPTQNSDYTKLFERTSDTGIPIACRVFQGNLYYMVSYGTYIELHMWSISGATDVLLQVFQGASPSAYGVGDKYMREVGGKLVITVPPNEIWETDGDTLVRVFVRDPYKRDNLEVSEASCYLTAGCIIEDAKAWWGNLMYDGARFYNTWKAADDLTTTTVIPLFTDTDGVKWHTDSANIKKLYFYPLASYGAGVSYKTGSNKNFLVLSNHDKLSGVDKLLYSVQHIFKTLSSGNTLKLQYLIGDLTSGASWTDTDSAQFAVDGAIFDKKIFFPTATTFKKVWFRIVLRTSGAVATTPTVTDTVIEYLPVPSYKKLWQLQLNMADEVKTIDGTPYEQTARELKGRMEIAWWTKSVLDYQDLDYATTTIDGGQLSAGNTTVTVQTDGTLDFPEQGRIRIEEEEILYTGKTNTTFTGCTRGARGTRAVAHADDTVVNNAYKVLVTELQAVAPILNEGKYLEHIVSVNLREV